MDAVGWDGRMFHYSIEDIRFLRAIDFRFIKGIDLETTGLDPDNDEILQVAVIDGAGTVLLNRLVKPSRHEIWPTAQRVTGLSPQDVADGLPLACCKALIEDALKDTKLLVGFNLSYDLGFLRAADIDVPACRYFDVMREYAPVARVRGKYGKFLWRPLHECARHYGVELAPHDALSDIQATMQCFTRMLNDDGSTYRVPGTIPYLKAIEYRFR